MINQLKVVLIISSLLSFISEVCAAPGMDWSYWTAYCQLYWWNWKDKSVRGYKGTFTTLMDEQKAEPPALDESNVNTAEHFREGLFVLD